MSTGGHERRHQLSRQGGWRIGGKNAKSQVLRTVKHDPPRCEHVDRQQVHPQRGGRRRPRKQLLDAAQLGYPLHLQPAACSREREAAIQPRAAAAQFLRVSGCLMLYFRRNLWGTCDFMMEVP